MIFELFHLSLLEAQQKDIDSHEFSEFSREDWLRHVFSEPREFYHNSSFFHYVSIGETKQKYLVGRIGREISRPENSPPAEGLEERLYDTWSAAAIVLDPTNHAEGQRLSVQLNNEVGKPSAIIAALVKNINEDYPNAPYSINCSEIVDSASFWDFVAANKGNITSLQFEFIAPNMLGADDNFYEEMKEFRDSERAKKIRLSLENPDGIEPNTKRVHRAVNYASEGRGKINAKAAGGKRYSSEAKVKKSRIEHIQSTSSATLSAIAGFAERILGRKSE